MFVTNEYLPLVAGEKLEKDERQTNMQRNR